MHIARTRITAISVAVMVASVLALECSAMHDPVRGLGHKYHDCAVTPVTPTWLHNMSMCVEYPLQTNHSDSAAADVDVQLFQFEYHEGTTSGHVVTLRNPHRHFSIVPPVHGCGNGLSAPTRTAGAYRASATFTLPAQPPWTGKVDITYRGNLTRGEVVDVVTAGCVVATNAGFFNTTSSECHGNLVSDGVLVQSADRMNAHFGIRQGKIVVGYLTPQEARDPSRPFDQLVGGVGWLVRDGKPFVYDSMDYLEDMGAQETGNRFATIVSGRTALGHDKHGNIMIVQFDGQSWRSGIDLGSLATILVDLGVVNAINLDGGGSTTMTRNTTLINNPTYQACPGQPPLKEGHDNKFRCERNVTSIVCIHDLPVAPPVPPKPTCPALNSRSHLKCEDCLLLFARCVDTDTMFGNVSDPVPGWPTAGRTTVEPEFLSVCTSCCGCSQWSGDGKVLFPPEPNPPPEPYAVSTVVLGALLFCSLALNGAGLWWYLHRHSAATTARHFKLPTSPERDIARHGRDLHSPSPGDGLELARVQMHEASGDEHSGGDDDELGDDVALVPPSRGSLGVR